MKYRGADGWVHAEGVSGPRRYKDSENITPPRADHADGKRPLREHCPNCNSGVSWLRIEGKCKSCGFIEEGDVVEIPTSEDSGKTVVACCGSLGLAIGGVLVAAGMGYGFGGGGGMVAGIGLALVTEAVVICALTFGSSSGKSKADSGEEA